MDPDVAAVVEELDAHRAKFEAFCRSLSEEQLARQVPGSTWIVKDFISHLATIDGPVGEMFRTIHEGGDPGMRNADGGRFDVDHWNDAQVAKRRELTVEEILGEATRARSALHEQLAALTKANIDRTIPFGGDSKRPAGKVELRQYLRGWCKHDPMHVVDMARALPEVKTPELEAWLDDPIIRGYQAAMNPGAGSA
jgi:hypothetical protein